MNSKPSNSLIVGIIASMLLVVLFVEGIRRDLAKPLPAKPEIDSVVVETNVTATIVTWTKTSNGHKFTFGYVQINGKPHFLLPFTE